ncbi:zinc finger MYM-type 3-like [Paramuricea clavata]|uniref:Zinc finger MYM-type 3-like n=1 Tax=Paramuricea clavata TaxID=317549 RepID=A0A6S7JTI5_PARCT|nr:zinc finger MYM-type 3-like [Paramuricea clavata]
MHIYQDLLVNDIGNLFPFCCHSLRGTRYAFLGPGLPELCLSGLSFLMKEAGLEIKTAHCLRVTTATNLFRAGHQEKLIRERTGHVSSALFTYEKPSNDQAMAVFKCVGPSVSKVVSLVDNCFNTPSKPKEDEKFQISDEELDKFLSEVDWSKIDKETLFTLGEKT